MSPDPARMAAQSWPDQNPQFRRGWGLPPRKHPRPPRAPRTVRACHDRWTLNGKAGIAPPFGVTWTFGRGP
jgi:hypothetical protein